MLFCLLKEINRTCNGETRFIRKRVSGDAGKDYLCLRLDIMIIVIIIILYILLNIIIFH